MMKFKWYALEENNGEGNDLPGDRGDELEKDEPVTDEAADKQAEEDLKALEDEKAAEEQPRDAQGKFTKKEKEDEPRIPKAEFDKRLDKERQAREAAEARAAELEDRLRQEEKSADIQKMEEAVEGLEKQHAKLLLDGEHEKAAAIMKEIRHAERQIARMESDDKASQATAAAVEQVRMEAAIAKLEADYPVFNPDSEAFDQDLVDIVLAEQARLIRSDRIPPSKALVNAATKIMKKFEAINKGETDTRGLGAAKDAASRKAEQVAKNLETAKKQAPSMKETGLDSDKAGKVVNAEVTNMTMDEWAALPESTRAKLRGDFA